MQNRGPFGFISLIASAFHANHSVQHQSVNRIHSGIKGFLFGKTP